MPIGISALVLRWRRLPHIPGHPTARPNPLAVVLATGAVGLLSFGLVQGSDCGWGSAPIVASLLGAGLLLAQFGLHCATSRSPLIHPSVFGGMILTGVGVGLTLPNMMATASAALPPQAFRHRDRRHQT